MSARAFPYVLVLIVGASLGGYLWWAARPLVPPPGILAPEAPQQTALAEAPVIRHKGYHLTPVAHFVAEARVLGIERYRDDRHAALAPYDLALGWGPMSDTAILDQYTLWQTGRAYRWDSDTDPLSTPEVIRHSTNIHLIPANATVAAALLRLRPGHLVRVRGPLVHVLSNDGGRWRTSLTRTDAGVGACEILWVEALDVVGP